jgi:hypothetical protein
LIFSNKALWLATKALSVKSSFNTKPTPPCEPDSCNALGFNTIKPTSGKNLPYEPEGVYPGVTVEADTGVEIVALPFVPLTISNTLPASEKVRVVTSFELSVN